MAKNVKSTIRLSGGIVEIKSKFDAEFRRFSIDKTKTTQFDDFYLLLEQLHHLVDIPFIITYTDPVHMDLLPINNSENFSRALSTAKPGLKVLIQRKGESYGEVNGYGTQPKKRNPLSKLVNAETSPRPRVQISLMEDFRRVSAIIDVDIVPETHRRVRLMKNGSDKPLGFYIRDGTSVRATMNGLEKVPAIFISRLVPGGLAESTGLLAVNDEVLEVNGIEVAGKKLDQVTDMMVANSSNLIITVKPVNQGMTLAPTRGGIGRHSNISSTSHASSHHSQASNISFQSAKSFDSADAVPEGDEEEEDDEVHDHISPQPKQHQDNYFSNLRHEDVSGSGRSGGSSGGRGKGGKSKSSSSAAAASGSSGSVASTSGGGAIGGAAAMSSEHDGAGDNDDPILTL